MPALKPEADLWNHVFGIGNSDKRKLSGFHSRAKTKNPAKGAMVPRIKWTSLQSGETFYLCGWNYFDKKQDPKKWSTMFPDTWDEIKVKDAINQAITYWNLNGSKGDDNEERLKGLMKKYKASWVGQCKVDGYTYIVGGKSSGEKVTTAFPLMGANSNFANDRTGAPARVNEDVDAGDE